MLLSFAGLAWFCIEIVHVPAPFAPLLAICCETLILWLFALVGGMTVAMYALLIAGVALLVWMLLRRAHMPWSLPLFILGCVLLWLRYRQTLLLSYDDFSHWGLIARYMATNGELPGSTTALIAFQSYPPATACWISFVCRFWGASDGLMLAAQAWMSLAALWTLNVFVSGDNKCLKALLTALPMLAVLSLFQGTASLMVDNLLSAFGIGVVVIVLWGRAAPQRTFALATPVLTTLVLVKDSGLFFMAILWGLLWLLSRRKRKALYAPVVAPIAARALWWAHLKLTFPSAETTKHAMSIANMRTMGSDKSYDDLFDLAKRLFGRAARPDNQTVQVLLLMLVCCAGVLIVRRAVTGRYAPRAEVRLLLGSFIAYGLYMVALWGMYAFTLSLETACKLVAFERYNSTCALFLYGALAVYLLLMLQRLRKLRFPAALGCCVALALLFAIPSWRAGVPRLFAENYFVPVRGQMQELFEKQPLLPEQTATVYLGDTATDTIYAGYMARYQWMRPDIAVCCNDDVAETTLGNIVYALTEDDALREAVSACEHKVAVVTLP